MQVKDFIRNFRTATGDEKDPPFWADEVIVGYLNEAVQEACERAKLIEERLNPQICSVQVVPGEATCALHASIFEIKRVTLQGRPLHETSTERLDMTQPGWELRKGRPCWFLFEQANGVQSPRLRLVPTPVEVETIALTVFRGALKPIDPCDLNARPELHERFHLRLVDWMLHRAYLQQDAEIFNETKAATSLGQFEHAFGERPDANVQRKQRDHRPKVVRYRW